MRFLIILTSYLIVASLNGQVNNDKYILYSDFINHNEVIYQRVTSQYITNENQMLMDVKLDTCYLIFKRDSMYKNIFHLKFYSDENGEIPYLKTNSIEAKEFVLKFNKKGKIAELVNWKMFRDEFLTSYSAQVRQNIITASDFAEEKERLNKESVIRRMAMEDIHYLFYLYGDTAQLNIEKLRMKAVRSPFSNTDVQIIGNLKPTKPEGTQNTLILKAINKAGPKIKQQLMEECRLYIASKAKEGEILTDIKAVGLNSEQEYKYNMSQRLMLSLKLSDVLVINLQSRGNIREFTLWDIK